VSPTFFSSKCLAQIILFFQPGLALQSPSFLEVPDRGIFDTMARRSRPTATPPPKETSLCPPPSDISLPFLVLAKSLRNSPPIFRDTTTSVCKVPFLSDSCPSPLIFTERSLQIMFSRPLSDSEFCASRSSGFPSSKAVPGKFLNRERLRIFFSSVFLCLRSAPSRFDG